MKRISDVAIGAASHAILKLIRLVSVNRIVEPMSQRHDVYDNDYAVRKKIQAAVG